MLWSVPSGQLMEKLLACGKRTQKGQANFSQRKGAVGSGRHSAPYAAALKACWARIPDSLLMSGRTFVGARV